MNKKFWGILIFTLGLILNPHTANAAIFNVPSELTPTITLAMNRAKSGDTIFVGPGNYREYVVMKQGVELIGSGPGISTIIANSKDSSSKSGPVTGASYSSIDGFSIQRTGTVSGDTCLFLNNVRHMLISNIEIIGTNMADGIKLQNSNYNTIQFVKAVSNDAYTMQIGLELISSSYNHILKNNFQATARGMYLYFSHNNKIEHNLAVLKPAPLAHYSGGGIYLFGSENTVLIHNTGLVLGNDAYAQTAALLVTTSPNTIAKNNIFFGTEINRDGVYVQGTGDRLKTDITGSYSIVRGLRTNFVLSNYPVMVMGTGILFVDPQVDLNTGALKPTSPAIDKGDPSMPKDPNGSIADIGAFYL